MDKLTSIGDVCEILGLSKSRFYALLRDGIFPEPMRNPSNNRPVFNSEQTEMCRHVLRTHIGVNGKPWTPNRKKKTAARTSAKTKNAHEGRIVALAGFGITTSAGDIDKVLESLPDGGKGMDEAALILKLSTILRNKA